MEIFKNRLQSTLLAMLICLMASGEAIAQRGRGAARRGGEEPPAFDRGAADRDMPAGETARRFDGAPRRGAFSQDALPGRSRAKEFQRQTFYRGSESDRASERRDDDDQDDDDDFDRLRTDRFRDSDSDRFGRLERDREIIRDGDRGRFSRDVRAEFDWRTGTRRGDDWRRIGDRIRRDWRDWDRDELPFRYGWWNNYRVTWPVYSPYRSARWRDRPYYWWSWTPANRLTNWLVFDWSRPNYWEYGPGRNIYYQDDYVYYDGRRVMPVDDYYQYIYDLAHDVPSITEEEAEEMQWSPLGVFAVTSDSETDSQRVLQLAVSQDGVLSGTYFNRENDKVHPLEGKVDERTQRAAWSFAGGEHEAIVFETSLYNLTRPESTMMVHFGPRSDEMEVWHLIRLEQPESESIQQPRAARRGLP